MTEIDVVKKSSRAWLWVLIALVIIAVLFFLVRGGGNDTGPRRAVDHHGQPFGGADITGT